MKNILTWSCMLLSLGNSYAIAQSSRPTPPTSKSTTNKTCIRWSGFTRQQLTNVDKCLRKHTDKQYVLRTRLTKARITKHNKHISQLIQQVSPQKSPTGLLLKAALAAMVGHEVPHTKRLFSALCRRKVTKAQQFKQRIICSYAAMMGSRLTRNTCTKGCKRSHHFPLRFASNSPMISVTINKKKTFPMLIDTGASTSVITTRTAKQLGIPLIPEQMYYVNSPGVLIKTYRALVDITMGSLHQVRVPVSIIDLPIGNIGGIISPQTTWEAFAVKIDFQRFSLTLSPRSFQEKAVVSMPWLFGGLNPVVFLSFGKRPERPFTLDTGAATTLFKESYERLGTPLPKKMVSKTLAAGKKSTTSWVTTSTLKISMPPIDWHLRNPLIMQEKDAQKYTDFKRFGLVGMDFLMGRVLILDPFKKALFLSSGASLPPWKKGDKATFLISGTTLTKNRHVVETVTARTKSTVTLKVELQLPNKTNTFFLLMNDNWKTRGSWLLSRQAVRAWDKKKKTISKREQIMKWLKVFMPFRVSTSTPKIESIQGSLHKKLRLSCSRVSLSVQTKKGPATLSIIECPKRPWRTMRLRLTHPKGSILWQYERQGFQVH